MQRTPDIISALARIAEALGVGDELAAVLREDAGHGSLVGADSRGRTGERRDEWPHPSVDTVSSGRIDTDENGESKSEAQWAQEVWRALQRKDRQKEQKQSSSSTPRGERQ